jgi:hypothetical protein
MATPVGCRAMTLTVEIPYGAEKVRWLLRLAQRDGAAVCQLKALCGVSAQEFKKLVDRLPTCRTQGQLAAAMGCPDGEFSQRFADKEGKQIADPRSEWIRELAKIFGFAPKDGESDECWRKSWEKSWTSFMPSEDSDVNHSRVLAKEPMVSIEAFQRCYAEALVGGTLEFQTESLDRAVADRTTAKGEKTPSVSSAEGSSATAEAKSSGSRAAVEQRVDAAPVMLIKGPSRAPEPCTPKGLAAITLVAAQVGYGRADVGFEISCGKSQILGMPVTVRAGEMTWDCGGGQLVSETRKGFGSPFQPNDAVKLEWNGATRFKPSWRVEASGVSIGDLDVSPGFGTVEDLAPGCSITATFGVWRPDIEGMEVADIDAAIAAFDGVSILGAGAGATSDLSDLKKLILIRLAAAAIESQGDFIVLCRHTITFVQKPTE